jgi:predicted molibdopterin-dependent oxidoreductase YjgC
MITLTIDGIEVTVERGASILEAAEKAGVRIPTLCHDKRLIPFGACRMCVVELKGRRGLVPACFNPARNGMEVLTQTPTVIEARRLQLQLLLRQHPLDCPVCEAGGACQLQNLVFEYDVDKLPFPRQEPKGSLDLASHLIKRDMSRCVLCGCCVRICNEVQGVNEISFVNRGIRTEISTDFGRPLDCEFCGQCVSACPVGAMVAKHLGPIARPWEVHKTRTTCGFCGLGCALVVETKDGKVARVSSQYELGTNEGNLCVKGRFGWPLVHSDKRLTKPLLKQGDGFVEVSWEKALEHVASRWSDIKRQRGGEALAVLGSSRLTNEEAYLLQRLARGSLGTPHLDHAAGLGYRGLLDGLRPVLGYAAATNPIRDIRDSDVILAVGGNFKETHPVAKNQVILAAGRRKSKVFVVDHLHTSLCDIMGAQAIFVRPGTEALFLRGMMRVILDEGIWDRALVETRAEGLEELKDALAGSDPASVAELTGARLEEIQEAARAFAQAPTACLLASLETLAVGDSADLAMAAACLCVLTGKLGRKGCGLHLYGEKANSQGALDMGLVPGFLPGYRDAADPGSRELLQELWQLPIPGGPGLGARGILEACLSGKIRSLYLVAENPVGTYPDQEWVSKALQGVEFLVVQDAFLSDSARLAHVVLPASIFLEKQGSFTSVDRRIQRLEPAVKPPGQAMADFWIMVELAKRMGTPFPFNSPAEVWGEMGKAVQLYQGLSLESIPEEGLAWPVAGEGEKLGTPVLYGEGFPGGRARLQLQVWRPPQEGGDSKTYPFFMHPQSRWFHSGTFSTWSPTLMELCPEPTLLMHMEDARELGLEEGDRARVVSPRGEMVAQVKVRYRGPRKTVQVAHHFQEQPLNRLLEWGRDLARVRVEKA